MSLFAMAQDMRCKSMEIEIWNTSMGGMALT